MHYERLYQTLQQQFERHMPLSPAQIRRFALLCQVVLMSQRMHLSFLARCLPMASQQDSRIRWIRRALTARFMQINWIYRPILQVALQKVKLSCWHLVIDRTALVEKQTDLVTISLQYHRRAIPLLWQQIPHGGVELRHYIDLVYQCAPLIPPDVAVIFHGDAEFGGSKMIRALRHLGWDFILAQRSHVTFWYRGASQSQPLSSLPVHANRTTSVENIALFGKARLDGINLLLFAQKRRNKYGHLKHEVCYLATSLPLTKRVRRLGRRRWGIEPFHRDLKSAGWQVTQSRVQTDTVREGLLLVLATCYLVCVCLGRWLSKTGRRRQIDSHPRRHLSLFRIGWDLIVHYVSSGQTIPIRLCLYS